MKLPNLRQQVRNFLTQPSIIQTCVNFGIQAAQLTVVPLNAFLKHLVVVQGLDPNARLLSKFEKELQALSATLDVIDPKEYHTNFDTKFFQKKLQEVKSGSSDSKDITEEDFRKYTDLSNFPTPFTQQELEQEALVREVRSAPAINVNPIEELSQLLGEENPSMKGELTANNVGDALNLLAKIASHLEEDEPPADVKELFARGSYLQQMRENIRGYQQGTLSQVDLKEKVEEAPKAKNTKVKRVNSNTHRIIRKALAEEGLKDIDKVTLEDATDLVKCMVARGLCDSDKAAMAAQIDQIIKFNLNSYRSLKRIVEKHPIEEVKATPNAKPVPTKFKGTFRRAPRVIRHCSDKK